MAHVKVEYDNLSNNVITDYESESDDQRKNLLVKLDDEIMKGIESGKSRWMHRDFISDRQDNLLFQISCLIFHFLICYNFFRLRIQLQKRKLAYRENLHSEEGQQSNR